MKSSKALSIIAGSMSYSVRVVLNNTWMMISDGRCECRGGQFVLKSMDPSVLLHEKIIHTEWNENISSYLDLIFQVDINICKHNFNCVNN